MEDKRAGSSFATDSDAEVPLEVIPLHSTNLLTVLDEEGIIQYESPSIERIYGFTQDELVGDQVATYGAQVGHDDLVAPVASLL